MGRWQAGLLAGKPGIRRGLSLVLRSFSCRGGPGDRQYSTDSATYRRWLLAGRVEDAVRYEPNERCSGWLAVGVGIQGVVTVLAIIILVAAITVLAADQGPQYLEWSVFAALAISGVVSVLQAARFGRLGGGHVLISGVTPNYIALLSPGAGGGRPQGTCHPDRSVGALLPGSGGVAPPTAPNHHSGCCRRGVDADRHHDSPGSCRSPHGSA